MKIKIEQIKVSEERQRKDFGDIEELASSIEQAGLINPIVVDEDNNLIAGERRLRACRHLGHTSVEVRRFKSLSASKKYIIELEENVKRKDLTWQEHVDAVKRYHEMRVSENPKHQNIDTALELGLSPSKLSKDLKIALAVEEDPELLKVKRYETVHNATVRQQERAKTAAIADLELGLSPARPDARKVELILGDFKQWAQDYKGPKFNFIHCDFPYGIDIQDAGTEVVSSHHESYEDSIDVFDALVQVFKDYGDRFIADEAHMMFWTATRNVSYARGKLYKAGFKCQPNPLIWFKSDNKGISPDPRFNPRHVYETALFAFKGTRYIKKVKGDVVAARVVNQLHRSEKPREVLRHFFQMFVDSYTRVLDPTCGCGNALMIAEDMGARHALGIEINPKIYEIAKENLKL